MKKSLQLLLTTMFLILLVTNCDRTETPIPETNEEFGTLSLKLGLQVDALSAGRIAETVSTDDFIVTIHNASDGTEVKRFDPFSSAPAQIQLPTGEYFVRATNLEPSVDAAFEQPWYFGESAVFNIDKEELKTVDVLCTLANCKISFVYSQNVLDNFTNWNATAMIDDGSGTGESLNWIQGDDREGYFTTDLPIDIAVYLEYNKVFTDELITRNFNTTIADPSPATHYRINIDASLEDGKIVINLTVDDSFETVDIDLGDNQPKEVLVIYDVINQYTISLISFLQSEGYTVNLSATPETGYDGTNPPLDGVDAVIHLNGTTYSTPMPVAGQNSLVDFVVNQGKTYITDEWSAFEVDDTGGMAAMSDIVVLQRTNGYTDVATYEIVPEQSGNPILNGIPQSFTLPIGGGNIGPARTYASNQPVVLMTCAFGAAVAVREFENGGKAIGFGHAGNYINSTILSDPNAQKLFSNAVAY